jgi:large subunit ribosomal protein L9
MFANVLFPINPKHFETPKETEKIMIEVILLERVERLGTLGQVVKVKPGFARNFLLPKKKALRATKTNLEYFEREKARLEAANATLKTAAEKRAEDLKSLKLILIRQASEVGQLYGSVTARDLEEASAEKNQKIERSMILIDQPIKTIGLFSVKVKLHPDVTTTVSLNIARSPEEAEVQAKKGVAAVKLAAETAEAEAALAAMEAAAPTESNAAAVTAESTESDTAEKPKKARKSKKAAETDAA